MNLRKYNLVRSAILVIIICMVSMKFALASSQVLQEIQYTTVDNKQAIHIDFALPVRYVSHYPTVKSKSFRIDIRFLNEQSIDYTDLPRLETLNAPEENVIPLKDVQYETRDDQAHVMVNFSHNVSITVAQHDAKSLLIILETATAEQSVDDKAATTVVTYENKIFIQGKQALKDNDYAKAIEIFSMLISLPEHAFSKESLELLGISRERNSQLAQAKAVFEQYLEKYPKGEDAIRVRQRIADLIQTQLEPKKKLKTSKDSKGTSMLISTISQYYYYGQNNLETSGSNVDQSILVSQVSSNWRYRTKTYDMRSFFYASNSHDFEADANDGIEINSLYFKLKHYTKGYHASIGRQSGSSGGILGRFDGALLGYDASSNVRLNTVYGYPVDTSDKTSVQTNRSFVGLNAEINDYWKSWDINPYFISQQYDGVTDRQALGTELRYFKEDKNFYGMLDYDTYYTDLNLVILRGQYNINKATAMTMSVDYRNNPLLETGNALIGQISAESINDLKNSYSDEQIKQLAEQRTGDSTTLSIGATHSVNTDVQFNVDFTFANQTFMVDTGTGSIVAEDESQSYYSAQLILNRLINEKDATIFNLRFTNTNFYTETSFTVSNRLPLAREWRVDTRLYYSLREDDDGEQLDKIKPTVKFEYRYNKEIQFYFDADIEWWKYSGVTNNPDYRRISSSMGYRWSF